MKRIISVIICIVLVITCMPMTASAASKENGVLYHPYTGEIVSNGIRYVQLTEVSYLEYRCGDRFEDCFERNKLTEFKVCITNGSEELVSANLFKSKDAVTIDGNNGTYRLLNKKGKNVSCRLDNCTYPNIIIDLDPYRKVLIEGKNSNLQEKYFLKADWTYDGIKYTAKSEFRTDFNNKISLTRVPVEKNSSGKLRIMGWENTHVLNGSAEVLNVQQGNNYYVLQTPGKGTWKFIGCEQDPECVLFKSSKAYNVVTNKAVHCLNVIVPEDVNSELVYTLKFTNSSGEKLEVDVKINEFFIRNIRTADVKTTSVKLIWDSLPGAERYNIVSSYSEVVPQSEAPFYIIKNLSPGRKYQYSLMAAGEETGVSGAANIEILTKPSKVTSMKLSTASKTVKVSWKKKPGTGYQVQIADNSKFTKHKKTYKIKSMSTLSRKITKLKSGKKYYVRVRAINSSNGQTIYGKWSDVKTIICA